MFFIRFLRFICGYVDFSCTGGFPERFINLCSLNGIVLWDTKTTDGVLTASTNIRCFKKIRPCVKRSGMKLKITAKKGLPFILRPYIKRKGLAAGIAAGFILLLWLSSCIWTVEVKGNINFTEEQILQIGQAYGIFTGAKKKDIDVKDIKTRIRTDFADVSWFSANIYGANASLELTERLAKTEIIDKTTPCNIISDVNGEVIEIITLSGSPAVKIGSAVKSGDLLISGVTERLDGSYSFLHARGSAVIRTNRELSAEIKHTIPLTKAVATKTRYIFSIFGIDVPLGSAQGDKASSFSYTLDFNGKLLPVKLIRENYITSEVSEVTLTQNKAALLVCYNLMMQEKDIMKDAQTEQKRVTSDVSDGKTSVAATYINHEKTGIEKYFEVSME